MTLRDRVLAYCKLKNIAISAFERTSGISNGYFNSVTNRPSKTILSKIEQAFPDLNIDWLLTNEGIMIKKLSQKNIHGDNIGMNFSPDHTEIDRYYKIIEMKDEQIKKRDEQIDRLITLLEKREK